MSTLTAEIHKSVDPRTRSTYYVAEFSDGAMHRETYTEGEIAELDDLTPGTRWFVYKRFQGKVDAAHFAALRGPLMLLLWGDHAAI